MNEDLYISEAAWKEFQGQDIFGSIEEFIEAMPPATRGVHLLPKDIAKQIDGYRPLASEHEYNWIDYLAQHPDKQEELHKDDTSIFRVTSPADWPKEQSNPDSAAIGPGAVPDPYDWTGTAKPPKPSPYESEAHAAYIVDFAPILLASAPTHNDRTALLWGDIVAGLSPKVVDAAKECTVTLKRALPKHFRWTFEVRSAGSDETHVVHMRGVPRHGEVTVHKMDLKLGCSCEFWKWQGPDYHAHTNGYLDRDQRSDGSTPTVRDPSGINRVCKHVYAASQYFLKYRTQRKVSHDGFPSANTGAVVFRGKVSREVQRALAHMPIDPLDKMAATILKVAEHIHTDAKDA